jgi:general nucleoside transport system permease protein
LLLVNISDAEWVDRTLASMPESTRKFLGKVIRALHASPPASLGVPFENE